jgi:hypothetical protein
MHGFRISDSRSRDQYHAIIRFILAYRAGASRVGYQVRSAPRNPRPQDKAMNDGK